MKSGQVHTQDFWKTWSDSINFPYILIFFNQYLSWVYKQADSQKEKNIEAGYDAAAV